MDSNTPAQLALSSRRSPPSLLLRLAAATAAGLLGSVGVGAPNPSEEDPDQMHAAWVEAPATSLTLVWRTRDPQGTSEVEFRERGQPQWRLARGQPRPSGTAGRLHEATLRDLRPSTTYEYRARGAGGAWGRVSRARTAPRPGPQADPIEVVFVADTGLVGRRDGLTDGTEQIIGEIARLDPLLVLLGGDYAYANTDLRGGSVPTAVDAWFHQMAPVAERAVMMPTYGNHEIKLLEDYLFWAERFPTPEGHDNRRFYSFDVGPVHFVSILAWGDMLRLPTKTEHGPIGSTALQWIDADMAAARARGFRWIVPFLHVAPFSDGANHPSNVDVRAQLGPIFERHGVRLVLSAHDQSYERTFPLRGVPASLTVTSSHPHRYTAADGTTYLKVGPGGKRSNKNQGFSPWMTEPAPAYTAFRDNSAHHFARLRASARELAVEVFAIRAGTPGSEVQDRFSYVLE